MVEQKNTTQRNKWDETYVSTHANEIRDRARRKSLRQHGATGEPPKMDPVDAFNQGICYACSGKFTGALHKHIPGCPYVAPAVKSWQEFRDRVVPTDRRGLVQLRTPAMLAKLSEGAKRSYDENTDEGRAHRANLAAAVKGTTRIPYWPTIKLITSGHSAVTAAALLKERAKTIQERKEKAEKLTFGTDFMIGLDGKPIQSAAVIASREATNLKTEFDELVGFSTKRPPRTIIGPADARKWFVWRNKFVAQLLTESAHRKDSILKSLVPELEAANSFLQTTIPAIRKAARSNFALTVDDLGEFVCTETRREKTDEWYRTRNSLWMFEPWLLADGLARLRSDDADGAIVREMVGSLFGAKQEWIQNALRDRTVTVEPGEIEKLILRSAVLKDEGGRPRRREEIKKLVDNAIPRMQALINARNALDRAIRRFPDRTAAELKKGNFSEAEIRVGARAKDPKIAARHLIEEATGLSYDTVAEYHRG
jgi:hypothetical protein